MDFTPSPAAAFAGAFQAHIDMHMEMNAMEREQRDYLGGSRLGTECLRALGYEYTHTPKDPDRHFKGKTLRIFDRGHDGEERIAGYLRQAGFDLITHRPDGDQIGFGLAPHPETGCPRIAGHIDGVIIGGPDNLGIAYPCLWENKILNAKGYGECLKKGVEKAKPIYYTQMQVYMAYLELHANPALFTVMNADSGEIYAELVPFLARVAQEASDRGVRVISARNPEDLPRIGKDATDWRCRWCDYRERCWSAKEPAVQSVPTPAFWGSAR